VELERPVAPGRLRTEEVRYRKRPREGFSHGQRTSDIRRRRRALPACPVLARGVTDAAGPSAGLIGTRSRAIEGVPEALEALEVLEAHLWDIHGARGTARGPSLGHPWRSSTIFGPSMGLFGRLGHGAAHAGTGLAG